MTSAPDGLIVLDTQSCLRLVREHYVGRLGYVDGDRPVIVPVNYRLTPDGEVAVLTASGAKRDAAAAGQVMCLQVDEVDPEYHSSWSVLVTGKSRLVDDEDEAHEQARELRLHPWANAALRTHLVLVQADRVEGRRLH
ncbi:MAG TPA: pyridoxamine 5'-phosphate oxidase family protein [Nitriliruptorales bacterium]|jgi:nitroimidazol reductase NimA-like FMN-containing flavoprotein (pyridoxamine 5'-phosphate oxidase superfamily)